jgi:hypothetical protein
MVTPRKTPAEAIADLVKGVTKRWAEQRKAEERHARAKASRNDRIVYFRVRKATTKDVAYDVMRRAYLDASTGGTLPANARQIYYAARGEILERTGKTSLDSQYFCQTLLVDYVRENRVDWDLVWDDRGHFTEPHTKHAFGLGTIAVREYLALIGAPTFREPSFRSGTVATRASAPCCSSRKKASCRCSSACAWLSVTTSRSCRPRVRRSPRHATSST